MGKVKGTYTKKTTTKAYIKKGSNRCPTCGKFTKKKG